ncbi:putative signal transducing protein [Evansella clarkii]|uniref:putative signal transducing protein n=1 Tax=Evansella clarkii TaxID=79879 RepID=UPI000B438883|nr:DUF2007 domain-containing protein [Evansella clarkii]
MRWCPNCGAEFINKRETCTDCNVMLTEEEPAEENDPHMEYLETEFLVTASREIEANMLTSFLESNGIKTMRKYREAGGYLTVYMGDTSYGIDIYADKNRLEEAKELIGFASLNGNSSEKEKSPGEKNLACHGRYSSLFLSIWGCW